jgi:hypothetical protein
VPRRTRQQPRWTTPEETREGASAHQSYRLFSIQKESKRTVTTGVTLLLVETGARADVDAAPVTAVSVS